MKPVEYVSIGGYVFSLENDACEAARQYLSELETFYSIVESGTEVMEGIEERMAELLLEKIPSDGVVTLADVQQIMNTLGRPETIEKEEPEQAEEPATPTDEPVIETDVPEPHRYSHRQW